MEVRVEVLGPLRVLVDGRAVELGPARRRALRAPLARDPGRGVPVAPHADRVWSGTPAAQAGATIHAYVSRLRSALRTFDAEGRELPSLLVTRHPGYLLDVPADAVDGYVFAGLLARARTEPDPVAARGLVADALALWRGPAYLDVAAEFAVREAERQRELRLGAVELAARLDLDLGRHAPLVEELGALLEEEPLREGLHAALMVAQYRCGRQAEALQHYDRVRALLADELGIDPGPELREVHARILRQDPGLDPPARPVAEDRGPVAEPAPEPVAGSRIVGREAELARLQGGVDRARQGTTTTLVVVGEAGIGKSRLLEEVAARSAAAGSLVAWGHCWQHEGAPVLWPWVQALETLVDRLDAEELERALSGRGQGVTRLVPRLAPDPVAAAATTSLEGARVQLYDAVAGFLEVAARDRHLVLVLEDLHWGDRASRELLEYVATAVRAARLTVLVSVRTLSDDTGPVGSELLGALARTGRTERVDVAGLSDAAVRDYVLDRTGSVLDDHTAEALTDRTGGNPFFVGELVRLLVTDEAGTAEPALPDTVPDSVREVVLRRVQRLTDADRTVLTVAAVVGRTFDLDLLATAADLDAEVVDEAVDRATALGIVRSDQGGLDRHRFVHALTQQALLETTGPARLRRLHAAVADALGERSPERTAYHLAAAGGPDRLQRAVTLLVAVAEAAWGRGNLAATETVLLRALDLAARLGEEAGPAEMTVRVRLWSLYAATEGPGSPRESAQHERALSLVREHGGTRDLLAAHQARLAYLLWTSGVADLAVLVEEMDAAAESSGELVMALAAATARAHLLGLRGEVAAAVGAWDRAAELVRGLDEVPVGVFPLDPRGQVPLWQAQLRLVAGESDAAEEHLRELEQRLPGLSATTRAYVANTSALLHALADEPERSLRAAEASRALTLELGLTESLKHLDVTEAWARARLAPDPATVGELVAAIGRTEPMPGFALRPTLRSLVVDVLLRAERYDEARDQLDAAFADVASTSDVTSVAELHRQRALLLAATGRPEGVGAELAAAVRLADEQGAGLFLRRAEATRSGLA